jgi:hypothetical protein
MLNSVAKSDARAVFSLYKHNHLIRSAGMPSFLLFRRIKDAKSSPS